MGAYMKIITYDITPNEKSLEIYPIEKISPSKEDILFIDIETTGLSAKTSNLYMIGLAFYQKSSWHTMQFFADCADEETILKSALSFILENNFKMLLHYNGNRFDLPYIKFKCDKYGFADVLEELESFDIYKHISKYKDVFGIPDCKQKTVELFLGIDRKDECSGGELIDVYKKYIDNHDSHLYDLLILHNLDDLKGMFELIPILIYPEVLSKFTTENIETIKLSGNELIIPDFNLPVRASKVQAEYYNDINGQRKIEILMRLHLYTTLPARIGKKYEGCFFKIEGETVTIRIPLIEDELKYFYSNYKDYYYLPAEDTAMHKSIAEFVDKDHRQKATKANCYTRKPGQFLPQWTLLFSPYFKKSYEDKDVFFELTDDFKKNRKAMSLYATHIIEHIIEGK